MENRMATDTAITRVAMTLLRILRLSMNNQDHKIICTVQVTTTLNSAITRVTGLESCKYE